MRRMIRRTILTATIATLSLLAAASSTLAATIRVKPGRLDHFVVTAPPTSLAGESFLVRIEPYDANGNLITDFRGKGGDFAVNVSGGGEAVPPKLRGEDFAGGATVKVSSRRAGVLDLTVTEGDGRTPLASIQARILPNRLDRFVINAPREVTAGIGFQARVIAQDAYGNTKDDLADIRESLRVDIKGAGTAVSSDKSTPAFKGGEATFTLVPRKAGTLRVSVQETRTRSAGESAEVKVNPAAIDHFAVFGPKAALAGEKFIVLISAYDAFENQVTNYQTQGEGVLLRASGAGTLAPSVVAAKQFSDGQARVAVMYTKAEAVRVAVREQNREAVGESEAIIVTPGDPDHFRVITPEEGVAGEPIPAQIEALDRFGNLIEDYDLRGLEVLLSADGRGQLAPTVVSPASFVRGKAAVTLTYNLAESFNVVAGLSKDSLEKIVTARKRQSAEPPAPIVSAEDAARSRERAAAARAREEAQRAKEESEKTGSKEDAVKARMEADKAREAAAKAPAKPAPPPARPAVEAKSAPPAPPPPAPAKPAAEARPAPPPAPPVTPELKVLESVTVEEAKDQVIVRLATSGPVSYNASSGSKLSREWIWLDLSPVRADDKIGQRVPVSSTLVGEISIEQLEPQRVRVSLQVLPPGISYVVSQQDRAVVVKVIRTE